MEKAGGFVGPAGDIGGFEDEGEVLEAGIGGDGLEEGPAEEALTKDFMAVEVRAEGALGVVEVHAAEVGEADDLIEAIEEGAEGIGFADVEAGGESVGGVDAKANTRLVLDPGDNARELLGLRAEVGALTGGILDDHGDALGFGEGAVDTLGHAVAGGLGGELFEVRARVEVEAVEPEGLAPMEFIKEGGHTLRVHFGLGVGQVNQVAGVGEDLRGGVAGLGHRLAEGLDVRFGQRFADPLALVLNEECEAGGPEGLGVGNGGGGRAGGGDVWTDEAHKKTPGLGPTCDPCVGGCA